MLALLVAGPITAQDSESVPSATPSELALDTLIRSLGSAPLAEITGDDLVRALDLLSIAEQERDHIERSARISWALPGLGHYINGETGSAVAFALTDALIVTLTGILAYAVLPPAVQQENLNYLQSARLDIQDRWDGVSVSELIPTVTVVTSGALLSLTIRALAARSARILSDSAIREGVIRFEPEPAGGISRWR